MDVQSLLWPGKDMSARQRWLHNYCPTCGRDLVTVLVAPEPIAEGVFVCEPCVEFIVPYAMSVEKLLYAITYGGDWI